MSTIPLAGPQRAQFVRAFFASKAVVGTDSTRYRTLDRYEAHYAGSQYSHQTLDWWGRNADNCETISPKVQVPAGFEQPALELSVRDKRPTSPANIATATVDRFTSLLFSDTRRPRVHVEGDEDTEGFLTAVQEVSRFWARLRQARTLGGAVGSVLITAHVRNGKFGFEVHNPKHCQVLWKNRRDLEPEAVLVMVRRLVEEDIVDPKTRERRGVQEVEYLYRRLISDQEDTTFKPVRMENGVVPGELPWEEESTVHHGLGFFPGVWVQNMPSLESHDGVPDCHGGWQMLDTIDRIVSQMNKAVLLNLDPTVVLKYDPKVVGMDGGLKKGSENAINVGPGGSAEYLEITGAGIQRGQELTAKLFTDFQRVARVVFIDPDKVSGAAQSARAIEYLYAPMLEKADELRSQWAETCIVPLLLIVERMAKALIAQCELAGKKCRFYLPPKMVQGSNGQAIPTEHKLGPGGYVQVNWGPYFAPTEDDEQKRIANAVSAKTGGLIDHLGAIKHTSEIFGVKDPAAVKAVVDGELEAEAERALASLEAQVPFLGGDGKDDKPGGKKPPFPPKEGEDDEEAEAEAGEGGKA